MAKPTNKPNRRKATRWQDSGRNHITVILLPLILLLTACSPTAAPTIEVAIQGDLPTPTLEPTLTPSPLPTTTPQPSPTATPQPGLSGRILDQATGQPVAGAKVSAGAYTTTTDADGRYVLTSLPPGQYVLSATHEDYDPALSAILTLGQGQAITTDLELYAAGTTPYPQDPMLTNPLDPNGAPTAEEAERLARLQGLTGQVVSIEETKLRGQFLVNYKIGDDIRAAVAELKHEAWELTDDAGQSWYIIKVCGSQASRLPAEASIATPEPPLPLGGGKIAFASGRDGNFEIYLINADGSGLTRLTNTPADDFSPAWSPNGQQIAFVSMRGDNAELYVMNADGGGLTRLTDTSAGVSFPPVWSPNGQQIAFFRQDGSNIDIYVINADGSGLTRLTDTPAFDGKLAWSLDSQQIAFQSERDGNEEIYTINADGSDLTRLTNHPGKDGAPTWLLNGQQIAFWSDRGGNQDIYMVNADGSDLTRLTDSPVTVPVGSPVWSPNGRQIAFESWSGRHSSIYVMNADGSGTTRLTDSAGEDYSPVWSSDGRQIAFWSDREGNRDIYVVNADGSGMKRLTDHPHFDVDPAWSRSPIPMPTPPPSPAAMATVEPVSTLPAKPTRPATPAAVSPPKRLTFYYFYAKWCNYSQQMTPIIKQLDADYKDRMDFTWLNVDKTSSDYWCYKYGIRSIPAYVISDLQGNAVKVWVGVKPESVLAQGIEAVLASTGGGQAYSRTPPDCPNEHARITYPGMNETVSGVVHFRGSADIPNFEYYKFEFRPSGALQWQYLTRKNKPVSDGDLIEWWTNTIEPGVYDVRMIVVDRTGNYPEPCVVTVNVVR